MFWLKTLLQKKSILFSNWNLVFQCGNTYLMLGLKTCIPFLDWKHIQHCSFRLKTFISCSDKKHFGQQMCISFSDLKLVFSNWRCVSHVQTENMFFNFQTKKSFSQAENMSFIFRVKTCWAKTVIFRLKVCQTDDGYPGNYTKQAPFCWRDILRVHIHILPCRAPPSGGT